MIMNFIYQNELRDSQISVCRGVLILPYKNGYLSTVCCDIAKLKIPTMSSPQLDWGISKGNSRIPYINHLNHQKIYYNP